MMISGHNDDADGGNDDKCWWWWFIINDAYNYEYINNDDEW